MKGEGFVKSIMSVARRIFGGGKAASRASHSAPVPKTAPAVRLNRFGRPAVTHASLPLSVRFPGKGFPGAKHRTRGRGLVWSGLASPSSLAMAARTVKARSGMAAFLRKESARLERVSA